MKESTTGLLVEIYKNRVRIYIETDLGCKLLQEPLPELLTGKTTALTEENEASGKTRDGDVSRWCPLAGSLSVAV
jgi:hypothetical protein